MKDVKIMSLEDASPNASETDNKELISKTEIRDTPFTVIEIDKQFFGVMGQHRITEVSDNKMKVIKELKKFSWNRVMQVMMLLGQQGIFNNDKIEE